MVRETSGARVRASSQSSAGKPRTTRSAMSPARNGNGIPATMPDKDKFTQTPAKPAASIAIQTAAMHSGPASAAPSHGEPHFEFMGPYIGPVGIVLGLPLLVWGVSHYCTGADWTTLPTALPAWSDVFAKFTSTDLLLFVGWWCFQAALHLIVPGRVVDGTQLRDGSRLKYCVNGWNCFLITVVAALALHFYTPYKLTYICDHFEGLAVASILFSCALSVYLYAVSFTPGVMLAEHGNTGYVLYDFFIGRELNPRVWNGALDLKFFCELRPGLFGWWLINTAMLLKQWESTASVSVGMAIVYVLQALYIADSVFCEDCILTTIDIIQDGFGFMLAFGDLAWVPFMYSLQARYLADNASGLPTWALIGAAVVGAAGFVVFRAANAQKDAFKTNPDAPHNAHLKSIPTARGTRLLCDGWWAVSRHINYFGDWLLSLGMSLATGYGTPVTYFYPAYFAVLLIHREMRDEHKCALKYGEAWQEYKRRVPYRIIPGVY